jgi:hypothetical protein
MNLPPLPTPSTEEFVGGYLTFPPAWSEAQVKAYSKTCSDEMLLAAIEVLKDMHHHAHGRHNYYKHAALELGRKLG